MQTSLPPMDSDVRISHPGHLLLPDGKVPVLEVIAHRNQEGQIQELSIYLDPSPDLQAKIRSHKSVPLQLQGMEGQIDLDTSVEFCAWPEANVSLGHQHFHQKMLDQNQIQKIERLLEMIASRQKKTAL